MALRITDISTYNPGNSRRYFCDANVWIAELRYLSVDHSDNHLSSYAGFIESVVNLNNESVKSGLDSPKILMTSLLLSEIINGYMRKVAMPAYFKGKNSAGLNFKDAYRNNPGSDFSKQLKNLVQDLSCFEDYLEFADDDFTSLRPIELIRKLDATMDFNDRYFYEFLKGKDIPFVTDDADCCFDEIVVITNNKNLLKKISGFRPGH